MDSDAIRKAVIDLNPPKKGEPMTITSDLAKEIASLAPFWAPLLKDRDVYESDGGDEYMSGLIEMFGRIYTVLKAHGAENSVQVLGSNQLFALDEEMSKSDLNLGAEYPALVLNSVLEQGSFGAGVYMAYALLETALAVVDPQNVKIGQAQLTEPQATPCSVPSLESLLSEVEAETAGAEAALKFASRTQTQPQREPVATPSVATPSHTTAPPVPNITNQPPPSATGQPTVPAYSTAAFNLAVVPQSGGWFIQGSMPATLQGAAGAADFVKALFGCDAQITMSGEGPMFSLFVEAAR